MLRRHYAKTCDIADFRDPDLIAVAESIRPELDMSWQFDRKTWEFAMLALFFEEVGVLDGSSRVLSVGAGKEAVVFWLASRVGRLVATDIYGEGEFASSEAPTAMLSDPASFSPYDEPLEGLEVRSMDARRLDFEDGSFDAVFSLSSIEHFGSPSDIRSAASEIGRVLRPGGHAYIATELTLKPAPAVRRAAEAGVRALTGGRRLRREVFSPETLWRDVIDPSGLELMQPLDVHVSDESYENLATRRLRRLNTRLGRFHPHIVLKVRGETFTSLGLPLRASGG